MKTIYIVLFILIIIILIGFIYLQPRLKIITGYAAKSMCSCVFVANRTPESVLGQDLNFSFVKYAKAWVDENEKAAYSTVFGLSKRKAVFREGLGCSLVFDEEPSELPGGFGIKQSILKKDTIWPIGDQMSDTTFENINYEKLEKVVNEAFDAEGESVKNTRAVLVIYKDQIVAEKYAPGFTVETPQLGWSMTKSITNAMVGLLVKEGKLSIESSNLFKVWEQDERKSITLNNLLQMNTGLDWNEQYGDQSDITLMLYRQNDKAGYAINRELMSKPGSVWEYSSGTTNIIQKLMKNVIGNEEEYWKYPYVNLFDKIGMESAMIEVDNTGTFVGSSYGYATPRDWAKFGLLYLHDGVWDGEQILPEGWVDYSKKATDASEGEYAAHFWTNSSLKHPDAPQDMFWCQGFHGQRVYIIPSKDMVIVRLGVSEDGTYEFDPLLKGIIESVQ